MKHETKIKYLLIFYVFYCAIIIGQSWDEGYYHKIGKINLDYLLSFGLLENDFYSKYRFSTLYWSFSSLMSQLFPKSFQIEAHHIINATFGLLAIVGLYKITRIILNKEIGKISALILFFIPFFFGHLAINSKDTILAFSHVWIIYYLLKYINKSNNLNRRIYTILKLSVLSAIGTGIQLLFLGSMVPILILFLINIVFFKKKSLKIVFLDIFLFLIFFYSILILFWVDTHNNIILQPINFFLKSLTIDAGWPFNLVNGNYFSSVEVPYGYILINYFYKLPEFVVFLYLISIPVIIVNLKKLELLFNNFKIVITFILFSLFYPTIVLIFIHYAIYDGVRLFIWSVPYLAIIPAITIFLIYQSRFILSKLAQITLLFLFLFHIFNFLSITPYHYTYLNYFAGPKNERYKRFENDYWSTSIKELILSSNLQDKKINFYTCGINSEIAKIYMKLKYGRSELTGLDKAKYIVMTNRTIFSDKEKKISNCYDEFSFKNVHEVKRNGVVLSSIGKIK